MRASLFILSLLFISTLSNADSGEESLPNSVPMPVRISRQFFDENLTGSIQIRSSQSTFNLESVVYNDPNLGTPRTPEAAREGWGCAYFYDLGNASICFYVNHDVTSIGVNNQDVSPEGMKALVVDTWRKNTGCNATLESLQFTHAAKNEVKALIGFSAILVPGTDCSNQSVESVEVQTVLASGD